MKIILYIASTGIGALAGWLFYKYIGCRAGGWALYSNAWSSIIIGALFGFLLLSPIVDKFLKNSKSQTNKTEVVKEKPETENNKPDNSTEQ